MQGLTRFARYWEWSPTPGALATPLPLLLGSDPFARFLRFADWLYATTQQTHRIALERLFDLIQQWADRGNGHERGNHPRRAGARLPGERCARTAKMHGCDTQLACVGASALAGPNTRIIE